MLAGCVGIAKVLRPWDSPGKNTGVGCHFLLQDMKVKSESEVAQSWFGALPGAFGLGRAQPQRRGTSP